MTKQLLQLASDLESRGDLPGAEKLYSEILAVTGHPDAAAAHYRLALLLAKNSAPADALRHLQAALHIDPAFGLAWLELADLAIKMKAAPLACLAGERAVELMPDNLAALIAAALAFDMNNREEDAVKCLEAAIAIKPDFSEAWSMLGLTCQNLLRLNEADKAFRKVIQLAPPPPAGETYSTHYWNLALLELLRGNFRSGFDYYRVRYNRDGWAKRLQFPQPLWQGEDLKGKKIFVAGEQGFGDVLMLIRYLPLLRAKGAYVMLLVDPALESYLTGWSGADYIIKAELAEQGDFDYQTGLFDLPYYFGTTLETIPAEVPYLPLPAPDEKTKLPDEGKKKIGIVYAGRREHGNDRRRSLPLNAITPLFDAPDAHFYNFTHHITAEDRESLASHGVTDLAPQIGNFRTSAQFVNQMDLIITCDTAMAHLAGGMGKKVWLLLPFAPEWRWLTNRDDSPWYPTMRLFRQRIKGDWNDVIRRVQSELKTP